MHKNITECYVTSEFEYEDLDLKNIERYEFTKRRLEKIDYDREDLTDEEFKEWAEENLDYETLYEIPMMNFLYYFPEYISFEEEDRYKTCGNTTLFYDNQREEWGVGMTGGGMDLTPELVDTFFKLERGIPETLARNLRSNYRASVKEENHKKNCEKVGDALISWGNQMIGDGERLKKIKE